MRRRAIVATLLAASTVACGALLGFPDETKEDPSFGKTDGSVVVDGAPTDGNGSDVDGASTDGGLLDAPIINPDGGCNCFGGTCNGGVCQPVAIVSGKADPNLIDNDGTVVYFASGGTAIFAVQPDALDAGVRPITNVAEPSINDLRARAGFVYFTNAGGGSNYSVSRCAYATGCATGRVEYGAVNTRKYYSVAVDSTKVYFTVADTIAANGGVWSCTQTGCAGATRLLQRDYAGLIATDGTKLAWLEGAGNNGIQLANVGGGGVASSGQTAVVDLAFGPNSDVYFVKSSSLWRQIGTQAPTQIAGPPEVSNAVAVRVDGGDVYWLNGGASGSLRRCKLGVDCLAQPTEATLLASGLQSPFGLTLSADSVYFTTRSDLKVWRLRK